MENNQQDAKETSEDPHFRDFRASVITDGNAVINAIGTQKAAAAHESRSDNHLEGSSPGQSSWETGQEAFSLSNPKRSHDEIVRRD